MVSNCINTPCTYFNIEVAWNAKGPFWVEMHLSGWPGAFKVSLQLKKEYPQMQSFSIHQGPVVPDKIL